MNDTQHRQKQLKIEFLKSTLLAIIRSHIPSKSIFCNREYLQVASGKDCEVFVGSLKDACDAARKEIDEFIQTEDIQTEEKLLLGSTAVQNQRNGVTLTSEELASLKQFATDIVWEELQSYRLIKDAFLGMQFVKYREYHNLDAEAKRLKGRHITYFFDSPVARSYAGRFVGFVESIQRVRDQEKAKHCRLLHHHVFRPTDIPDVYAITKFTVEKEKPFVVHRNVELPSTVQETGLHTVIENIIAQDSGNAHVIELSHDLADRGVFENLCYWLEQPSVSGGDARLVLHSTIKEEYLGLPELRKKVATYTVEITRALTMRRPAKEGFR